MVFLYMQVKQQGAVLALVPNQDYEFDMSTTFRGLLTEALTSVGKDDADVTEVFAHAPASSSAQSTQSSANVRARLPGWLLFV